MSTVVTFERRDKIMFASPANIAFKFTTFPKIALAEAIADRAHGGQVRKILGTPYVEHPRRVAAKAYSMGFGEDAIAAALLHDVLEDTELTVADLAAAGVSARTIRIVGLLTKWWGDDASVEWKNECKPAYYAQIMADADATAIKLLDRADNLRDMALVVGKTRKWCEKYLAKTEREFPPLEACGTKGPISDYRSGLRCLQEALGRERPINVQTRVDFRPCGRS